jgi:hypothetical protein
MVKTIKLLEEPGSDAGLSYGCLFLTLLIFCRRYNGIATKNIFGHFLSQFVLSASKKISTMALSRQVMLFRLILVLFIFAGGGLEAQPGSTLLKWFKDGNAYYEAKSGGIVRVDIPSDKETVVVARELLRPAGRKYGAAVDKELRLFG